MHKSPATYWIISGAVTTGALLVVASQADVPAILDAVTGFGARTVTAVLLMLTLGALLAAARLHYVARDMGHHLGAHDAIAAMAAGQVAGAVAFQVFGQIAARSVLLGRHGVSLPANIAMVGYERLVALCVSFVAAIVGAVLLFGSVVIDINAGGGELLRLAFGIVLAIATGAFFGWGRRSIPIVMPYMHRRNITALARNVALTIGIQGATAIAYAIAARSLAPHIGIINLLAATFIVMFAASLPISFAGWGVREISAIFALNAIGIPAAPAVAIAVLVGVSSLVVVMVLGAATALTPTKARGVSYVAPSSMAFDPLAFISWILPLAIATAIVFQIHAPTTQGGRINISPADPLALLAGALAIYTAIRHGLPQWRLSGFNLHLALITAVILLAFGRGVISFGPTDWAFANKTVGWFVLLGYIAAGALLVRHAGTDGLRALVLTFASVVVSVCLFDLAFLVAARFGAPVPAGISLWPIEGFSHNRNAFAYLLTMAAACLPFVTRYRVAFLAVLTTALWFCGSRAGIATFPVMVGVALFIRVVSLRDISRAFAWAVVATSVIAVLPDLLVNVDQGPPSAMLLRSITSMETSNAERFRSLSEGLAMFWQNPIFGAGLGAFMDAQTKAGMPMVIHATAVWILAEMGMVGFAVFAALPIRIVLTEWRAKDAAGATLVLLCVAFALMSAAHEMMYQRSVWFLAGALLAVPRLPSE